MIYGVMPSPEMDEEDCLLLEEIINEEIAKRGLTDRVRVNATTAVLSFIPMGETALNEAVDAGIRRYQAEE